MKYFFYIIKRDKGFAPNPDNGTCSLARCKPQIRKSAKEGDWVIGIYSHAKNTAKEYRGKLVYAMQVKEKISFKDYLKKFPKREDNISSKELIDCDSPENIKRDKSGKFVLISNNFYYFGKTPVNLPKSLKEVIEKIPRGHIYKGMEKEGEKLIKFLEKKYQKNKKYGEPINYISKKAS